MASLVIEMVTLQSDRAAQVVRKAEYFFLTGLVSVGMVIGTSIVAVTL